MDHQPGQHDDREQARYQRQVQLGPIGRAGQAKLCEATAVIVGCGGLGCTIAALLTRAGVGRLVIADRDVVDLTNLHRQILFTQADAEAAMPKAEAAAAHLRAVNCNVDVRAVVDDVSGANVQQLVGDCDVIVDGLDNFETRFLLNDAAVKRGIPYVYGGALALSGAVMTVLPRSEAGDRPWERAGLASPCLRCVFGQSPPTGSTQTCETAGVLGPLVSLVASYQATEAIKVLVGDWANVQRDLLSIDPWHGSCRTVSVADVRVSGQCPCCGQRRFEYLSGALVSDVQRLCGGQSVKLTPPTGAGGIDLDELAERLRGQGRVKRNRFLLQVDLGSVQVTLFADGRAIVKGAAEPGEARSVLRRYIGL